MSLLYLLPFYYDLGLEGIWMAKLVLEWYIFIVYFIMIQYIDWNKVLDKK